MTNSTGFETLAELHGLCSDGNDTFYAVMTSLSPVAILGIVGNVLVIIITWKNKEMRNPTNLLLTNISAADLMHLLILAPETISYGSSKTFYQLEWNGFYLLELSILIQDITFSTSIFTVTLLAIERYRALYYALATNRLLGKRGTKRAIVSIWFLSSSIITANTIFAYVPHISQNVKDTCHIVGVLLCSVFPSALTIYFYAKIVIGIYISKTICGQGKRSAEETDAIRRTVKSLLAVTAIITVSKFPYPILLIVFHFVKERATCTMEALWIITCVTSSLTPFVYYKFCTNYKEGLKNLCRGCGCNRENVAPDGSC